MIVLFYIFAILEILLIFIIFEVYDIIKSEEETQNIIDILHTQGYDITKEQIKMIFYFLLGALGVVFVLVAMFYNLGFKGHL